METSWRTGYVKYHRGKVLIFENEGIVWYDATKGIVREGWQEELEPFEGRHEGVDFQEGAIYRDRYLAA